MSDLIHVLEALLAFTFILLVVQRRRKGVWWLWATVFVAAAAGLRWLIPVEEVRDYLPYFRSFLQVKYGAVSGELLFEPYRVGLFRLALLLGSLDDQLQMAVVYQFHFAALTAFFLWLAYQRDTSSEAKIILFLAFYPTMAFVWLPAGMAYATACFLFLAVSNQSRYSFLQYIPGLMHASAIPYLTVMKTKELRPVLRALAILAGAVLVYLLIDSGYGQHFFGTLERYAETRDRRDSLGLLVFHGANVLAFGVMALLSPKFRKSISQWAMMGLYVGMYFVNPVAGLRLFPFVLITAIAQRIPSLRQRGVIYVFAVAYAPVYLARFEQVLAS